MDFEDRKISYFVLTHKNLSVVGVKGMLLDELEHIGALFDGNAGLEVAPIARQPQRDFLAVFAGRQPIVDITVDLYGSGASAIVAYSLDAERTSKLVGTIVNPLSFSPDAFLDADFVRTLEREFPLERQIYEQCETIARVGGRKFEDVFAAVRYGNFLRQYKGVPEDQALALASERYGAGFS